MSSRKRVLVIAMVSALLLAVGIGAGVTNPARALPAQTAVQSHLIPAVVYTDADSHIHEIALKGTWQDRDLTAAASAPVVAPLFRQPMAFRRSDGVSMVVYTGTDLHIHALYLELTWQGAGWQEVWHWADLSAITGSPDAGSNPYGYVRSDGISTVVYTAADGNIYDLRLEDVWIAANLSDLSGLPPAYGDPVAYVRGDGINAILCVGGAATGSPIYELRLDDGWKWANLRSLSGAPMSWSSLSAYVRSDGISTVNYIGIDGHVEDIRLETSWIWTDLTAITGPPGAYHPVRGYVRSDSVNAIVYATGSPDPGRVYQLWLDSEWHAYELTSVPNAVRGYYPAGYNRADGISAVVYLGTDNHIHDIRLETSWIWVDLSFLSGAPPAAGPPWPYNRSAIARVHLPIVLRSW